LEIKLNAFLPSSFNTNPSFNTFDMGIPGIPKILKATGGTLAHDLKGGFAHVDLLSMFSPLFKPAASE